MIDMVITRFTPTSLLHQCQCVSNSGGSKGGGGHRGQLPPPPTCEYSKIFVKSPFRVDSSKIHTSL